MAADPFSREEQVVRVFSLSLTACFLVAGCVYSFGIPINPPDPYSDALAGYLSQPRLTRVNVQRWLGPPAATRMDGKYEVYVALREIARGVPEGPVAEYYLLLVEYDDQGQLVRHDKIVGGGCTDQMLCIESLPWNFYSLKRPSLVEQRNDVIRHLVLYAPPDIDQQAKDSLMSPEGCRHFIYRSDKNEDPHWPPPVMLADPASGRSMRLPADGYMVFEGECEARQISVRWADWSGNFEEQALHLGGVVPGSMVTRLDPKPVKFWGWRYSLTAVDVSPDEATNEIRSRRLVLR